MAVAFGAAVLEGVVSQQDGAQDDVPQSCDGVVAAAVSAGLDEAIQELLVGDGGARIAQGGQGGTVFAFAPGEEGLRGRVKQNKTPGKGSLK
jgi:hypothetical protein